MIILAGVITLLSLVLAGSCVWRLYRLESLLRRARIAVSYKGRTKINRPIYDWLSWCARIDKDKQSTGQFIYIQGGTKIAVLERVNKSHGKTTVKAKS